MLECVFWLSLILVIYSYALYPFLLFLIVGFQHTKHNIQFVLKKQSRRVVDIDAIDLPSVGIIISAYNEDNCIAQRVQNLQALDYPKEKIKYYIGSDGSKDDTASILSSISDDCLKFTHFENNRGKASVLNDLVAQSEEELLIFSDANTEFMPDAINKLVRHFYGENPALAVCGELDLYAESTGENLDSAYWQYERILKFNESKLNALLGANGAIYAIRRSAYKPIQSDTVVDDFTIVFQVAVDGGRVVYDPDAVAREEVAPSSADEYKRRVRIGSGNYQAFRRFLGALNPLHGFLWFSYLSHKVLRWHTPHLLLVALACSLILAFGSGLFLMLFILQCAVYLFAYYMRDKRLSNKLLKLMVFWVNMNFALGHGALRYYRGGVRGTWDSTTRDTEDSDSK